MKIEIACFSAMGEALGRRLAEALADSAMARVTRCGGGTVVGEWTAECFAEADVLIFIGAVGIAVRAIAPHVRSKMVDPAVVAVDECGRFAISLLSGHVGGANALASRLAAAIGATPVVTTATDGRGLFAIDQWAAEQGFVLRNPEAVKRVAARLLDGCMVGLRTPFPVGGALPEGFAEESEKPDVVVDIHVPGNVTPLHIVPPVAVLGVGCRKGTPQAALDAALERLCRENRLAPEAIAAVCSIDLKREEPGLREFCRARDLPLLTFSVDLLARTKGNFAASAFVESVTGVDNVCERSAAAGGGVRPVVGKASMDGITMAVGVRNCILQFIPARDRPAAPEEESIR